MSAEITQLITYPIKSCAGIMHDETMINTMGLQGDRQLMLVDDKGLFLSQRQHPKLALIQPQISASTVELNAPGMKPLLVQITPSCHNITITVWNDTFQADLISTEANLWFSEYLGFAVRLVRYASISHRQIDLNYSKPGQTVAFADGFPLLVTHQASLDQLNGVLSQAVAMNRFRPNIVVRTTEQAWSEMNWHQLISASFQLNLTKACTRCVMTGVEQETGIQTGTEVLRTLKQQFAYQDKAVFGINAMVDTTDAQASKIAVGMRLDIM